MNIFISHKSEDAGIAITIQDKLEVLGGSQVKCFVSEKIPYGLDWFDKIRESLKSADVLLFLFTTSDKTWDWPLYEVGLATDLSNLESCSVVTLYSPGAKPPAPIKHIQAVEATEKGVRALLINIFCTNHIFNCDEPLNPKLRESDLLARTAEEISFLFESRPAREECFTFFFKIIVPSGIVDREEIPIEALIEPSSSALELFSLYAQPPKSDFWTWQDILDAYKRSEHAKNLIWIEDLGERMYWANQGSTLKETRSTLIAPKDGETYRPLLHKAEFRSDRSTVFEVLLVRHYEL